jgi:DNA polymerase-3 subunit gamma/tau
LFKDLQFSLQPRFHLEIGLVRMVQAGRLLPIEQALAEIGGGAPARPAPPAAPKPASPVPASVPPKPRAGPSPFETDSAKKSGAPPSEGDARDLLHAHLSHAGLTHLADAVENSRVTLAGADLQIATGKTYKMYLEDRLFENAVKEVFGRPLRIKITIDEAAGAGQPSTTTAPKSVSDDVTSRALANEEVQRFRKVFGGEVRKVRNLKE